MSFLKLNLLNFLDSSKESIISKYHLKISEIFKKLIEKRSEGSEMTGWIEWVNKDHSDLISKAIDLREKWINQGVETVVVVGTGGSYIGCKAALDFINSKFKNSNFEFIFVPYFSERYIAELEDYLKNRVFSILVISKSGTTLESSVAFRIFRELLFGKLGKNYRNFVAAITDKKKGILRSLVDNEGIDSFVIEDDIGGRYSTLTAVGLVPMILSGIDVSKVLLGAREAYGYNFNSELKDNSAALYASIRHFLFTEKKLVSECFICYDPHLKFCLEKAKQLFSESEGKDGKGIMPIILNFTPDLHSVGQLLQDGYKSFFETTLWVRKSKFDLRIVDSSFEDDDDLNWIEGRSLKDINHSAFKGTVEAHSKYGKINNLILELDDWTPENFGYFYYWLSLSAMFSSYLFEVNPFNQPGVEVYKKRMFELLGKF